MDKLDELPALLRQTLADHQWSTIPITITESVYVAAADADSTLYAAPQTAGLELVESVVVTLPAGGTGIVQLGSVVIPVGQGCTVIAPLRLLLGASDVRAVKCDTAGPLSLLVCGQQLPTFGVLAG